MQYALVIKMEELGNSLGMKPQSSHWSHSQTRPAVHVLGDASCRTSTSCSQLADNPVTVSKNISIFAYMITVVSLHICCIKMSKLFAAVYRFNN